jgi:putative heme-binding domain-containing protein
MIATSLAGSRDGAERLFAAVANGEASPRLLQEQVVLERLRATRVRDLEQRVKELTSGLPSPEARLQELIIARARGFPKAKPEVKAGKKAFATHCAACHQIGGEGGKVGPNLDGIGNRGLDRLLEDILDPNRNVDAAFRATTLDLADGRSLTGLLLREEGAVYILADAEGKEQRIPKDDVEKKTVTAMSPMPVNVAEKIPEDEFYHLLAYLLELRAK